MDFVTDTHPFIWSLFQPQRLSPTVRDLFEGVQVGIHRIIIPTVVIAESLMVVEKGRVPATIPTLLQIFKALESTTSFLFLELHPNTVIETTALTSIPDIFDRLIVAEARRLALPLVTRDQTISAANSVTTIWE